MRILSVSAALDAGGAERMAVDLANALAAEGHELVVAAPRGTLDPELATAVGRVEFPAHGRSPLRAAGAGLRVARAVRARRPDVIHSHNVKATAIAAIAARFGGAPPIVATFHGVVGAEDAPSARVLGLARVIVCVSDDLRRRMEAAGHPPSRLRTIANAVPPAEPLSSERRAAIDAELNLAGAPVVALVGRLAPVKAPGRFLEAAAIVAAGDPSVRFLVVGDGPLRPQLELQARALGIADRVRFTGLRRDARELIARADVLTVSSDSEGLSVVALEALAAGVPVVTTDVAGMRELLSEGAGVVAGAFTAEALAEPISALLADPALRRAMATAGPQLVALHYGLPAMIERYAALFAEVSATPR